MPAGVARITFALTRARTAKEPGLKLNTAKANTALIEAYRKKEARVRFILMGDGTATLAPKGGTAG